MKNAWRMKKNLEAMLADADPFDEYPSEEVKE